MLQNDAKSIFGDALELPVAERAAWLKLACPDSNLRAQVERLLEAFDRAEHFLRETPTAGHLIAAAPDGTPVPFHLADTMTVAGGTAVSGGTSEMTVGTLIAGRYKLVEPIGEGGMGSVWLAWQVEPVRRNVAIKLVKDGMDTRQVLARFEAERQALALMDHPNIAKVLDAGATGNGRPFFVMELVKGVPITRYCDDRRLSPRERLALFIPVCQAIQHAHQKGVIHRDIKPSNVLVAMQDDCPVPKVIDFGVAKATGQALTEMTLHTGFGLVGTPEYMAPEQAELNQLDVDTRADVYALGVLLYELLTGSPPFSRRNLSGTGLLDILRAVREQEPSKPSTRLIASNTLPAIAASRGVEPRKLTGLIRGELDWIVMRALEKDRNRRYETAIGLARDVERYLAGEPVQAVPPSAGYRPRKFVRRNRGPVAAAALLVLALAGGAVGTTLGLIRAETARQAEADQRLQVEDEKRRADDERDVAAAVTEFLREDLLAHADDGEGGRHFDPNPKLTMRKVLDRAAERVGGKFKGRPAIEAAIRRTIGEAFYAVGDYRKASEQLERSVELLPLPENADPGSKAYQLHHDVLRSLAAAHLLALRAPDGIRLFKQVLAAREAAYGPDSPEVLRAIHDLSGALRATADGEARNQLLSRVIESRLRTHGPDAIETLRARYELVWANASDRSPQHVQDVRDIIPALERIRDDRVTRARAVGRLDAPAVHSICELAAAHLYLGQDTIAIPLFEKALAGAEAVDDERDGPLTLVVLQELITAYHQAGRTKDYIRVSERMWNGRSAIAGPDHVDTIRAAIGLADGYSLDGQHEEALKLLAKLRTRLGGTLPANHPDTLGVIHAQARSFENAGQFGRAADYWAEVLAALRAEMPVNEDELLTVLARSGQALIRAGRPAEAEVRFREARGILLREDPDSAARYGIEASLGLALSAQGRHAKAGPFLLAAYRGLKGKEAGLSPKARSVLPRLADALAAAYAAWGNADESEKWRAERSKYPSPQSPTRPK